MRTNIVEENKWISIKEQQPKIGSMVLVYRSYIDDNFIRQDLFGYAWYWGLTESCEWTIARDVGQPWNPEYWLDIPEFPNQKDKL